MRWLVVLYKWLSAVTFDTSMALFRDVWCFIKYKSHVFGNIEWAAETAHHTVSNIV